MSKLQKIVAALSVTAVLSSGAYIVNEEYNTVALAIHLDDDTIGVKVKKGTVGDILSRQGIQLSENDRVEPAVDTLIKKGDEIKVFKARDVVIDDGGNKVTKKTTYKKVEDILKELNITLGALDRVEPGLTAEIEAVDTIKIIRVEKVIEDSKEAIDFATKEEQDSNSFVGERRVVTAGEKGEKAVTKEIIKENGQIVSEKKSEKIIKEAINEVVSAGTKERAVPVAQPAYTAQSTYSAPAGQYYSVGVVLSNGNTAGATGQYAAKQMEARTGVSAATWENIIARESNGQVNAYNPSGASGLFQTMPGWGSTATVEDQINAAVRAYNNQGLSAWGY